MTAATIRESIGQGVRDGREVSLTRVFDAPRERVFRAYTDPAAVAAWWGPRGCTIAVEQMDVRPGGAWRFIQTEPDGMACAFRGVYREVVAPHRLVYALESERAPGRVVVDTVTLEDLGGRTKLTTTTRYAPASDLAGPWAMAGDAPAAVSGRAEPTETDAEPPARRRR